jgi:endonuclease III related protein
MQPLAPILDTLESFYGEQTPGWPTDPYLFLIWWHCGYPPGEERCNRGWKALEASVGVSAPELAAARSARLARALKAGGMVPELRAARIRSIAHSVLEDYAGDLRAALAGLTEGEARKLLTKFPGIGAPGADRILLFAGLEPVAAVPSGSPYVLVRIESGREGAKYTETYRRAQQLIETQSCATLAARGRAYLLLQRHARELCKARNPKCGECPVCGSCRYFAQR